MQWLHEGLSEPGNGGKADTHLCGAPSESRRLMAGFSGGDPGKGCLVLRQLLSCFSSALAAAGDVLGLQAQLFCRLRKFAICIRIATDPPERLCSEQSSSTNLCNLHYTNKMYVEHIFGWNVPGWTCAA